MSTGTANAGDLTLIPPTERLYDGSSSAEQFVDVDEGFVQGILVPRAGLQDGEVFLDNRVASMVVQEQAKAHDELRNRAFTGNAGFTISEIVYRNWCGRPGLLGLQDVMVLIGS